MVAPMAGAFDCVNAGGARAGRSVRQVGAMLYHAVRRYVAYVTLCVVICICRICRTQGYIPPYKDPHCRINCYKYLISSHRKGCSYDPVARFNR
jgi:hypothetical protein